MVLLYLAVFLVVCCVIWSGFHDLPVLLKISNIQMSANISIPSLYYLIIVLLLDANNDGLDKLKKMTKLTCDDDNTFDCWNRVCIF